MATIKSYSDLQQSKKLAEFLPLESADMYWYLVTKGNPKAMFNEEYHEYGNFELPCWSLAALYNILPNTEHVSTTLSRGGWKIEPPEYIDKWWCEYENENDHTGDITVKADNPVDACYELILKLHELKML